MRKTHDHNNNLGLLIQGSTQVVSMIMNLFRKTTNNKKRLVHRIFHFLLFSRQSISSNADIRHKIDRR